LGCVEPNADPDPKPVVCPVLILPKPAPVVWLVLLVPKSGVGAGAVNKILYFIHFVYTFVYFIVLIFHKYLFY